MAATGAIFNLLSPRAYPGDGIEVTRIAFFKHYEDLLINFS